MIYCTSIGFCGAAVALAQVGHKRVAEGVPVRHAQEAAAIQGVVDAVGQGDAALQGEASAYGCR